MDNHIHGSPIEILLVEDNAGDVRLTMEALKDHKVANHISVARDGEEALSILHRQDKYCNAPRPDIILLDLNLPKKNGREVLEAIKEHPDLRTIPVVVLTTSTADEDILKAYHLHANCYISKPVDFDKFTQVAHQIENFWFTIVKLPTNGTSK